LKETAYGVAGQHDVQVTFSGSYVQRWKAVGGPKPEPIPIGPKRKTEPIPILSGGTMRSVRQNPPECVDRTVEKRGSDLA
jgi:hypothetical protein